ncbi:unnamed protein product [Alopecurus aequalis]
MSRAFAIIAVVLLATAVVPLATLASSAESIPFAKEFADGANTVKDAGEKGASAFSGAGQAAAAQMVDPDPASGIKADPSPARRR